MKYHVTVKMTYWVEIEVEADTQHAAEMECYGMAPDEIMRAGVVDDSEVDSITEILPDEDEEEDEDDNTEI
jgi:hypothetical protein